MKCKCSSCDMDICYNCVDKDNQENHRICSNCGNVMCVIKEQTVKCSLCPSVYHKSCDKWEKISKDGVTHFIVGCNDCREHRKQYIETL